MSKINRDDVDKLFDYGIYLPTKTLITVGNSDEETATNIIKSLHVLDTVQPDSPLTIKLNNCGGDEYHGLGIYDAIKACKSHVIIVGIGNVHSMGSIIFQAGDERIMTPNAKQLIHYGTPLHADPEMHAKSQWSWTKECKKFSSWMEQMYLKKIREKHPNFKLKRLQGLLNFDTVLSAEESVELGLADKILGEE